MRKSIVFAVTISLWILSSGVSEGARAQGSAAEARPFREVALSPNGARLAWIGPSASSPSDAKDAVYLMARSGGAAHRVNLGTIVVAGTEHELAWSPDGKRVAFLAEGGKSGQLALYVMNADGSGARMLTALVGFLATPRWSPDGTRIAFLFTDHASRKAGPLQAASRDTGVIGRHVEVQRIAVLELASGKVELRSPAGLYVHEYAWSPNGKELVATANPGAGDNGWYTASLFRVNAATGDTALVLKPGMQVSGPRWSPDGTQIAFVGGLMSDEPAPGGDIYVVPAAGGAARDVTPGIAATPNWVAWPSAGRILFTAFDHGGSSVGSVDVASGQVVTIWRGDATIRAHFGYWNGSLALSSDGATSAFIRDGFDQPPEVWSGAAGSWTPSTHANAGAVGAWGEARSVSWTSDSLTVEGWLIAPKNVVPGRKYPMVVVVHGGPASAVLPSWLPASSIVSALSGAGYYVFRPNPRGSYGRGESFTRGNVKDLGYGDLRDILHGVDAAVAAAPIDSAQVGITGWSYGGYMTMWTVTQTGRFKAAMAGAGIANWQSYWAQNGINDWLLPYFGATVYDDPAIYARSAPITFIKQVTTPTLVIVGEHDIECPAPQSYEFWQGLVAAQARTELVVYANEGHAFQDPAHERDRTARTLAWFDALLKAPYP